MAWLSFLASLTMVGYMQFGLKGETVAGQPGYMSITPYMPNNYVCTKKYSLSHLFLTCRNFGVSAGNVQYSTVREIASFRRLPVNVLQSPKGDHFLSLFL